MAGTRRPRPRVVPQVAQKTAAVSSGQKRTRTLPLSKWSATRPNSRESQLARWPPLLRAEGYSAPRDLVRSAALARDLQALRDWYARTSRPGLREALLADAKKVVQRMQRFLASRGLELPDLSLH